jgi:hypothetical protein
MVDGMTYGVGVYIVGLVEEERNETDTSIAGSLLALGLNPFLNEIVAPTSEILNQSQYQR